MQEARSPNFPQGTSPKPGKIHWKRGWFYNNDIDYTASLFHLNRKSLSLFIWPVAKRDIMLSSYKLSPFLLIMDWDGTIRRQETIKCFTENLSSVITTFTIIISSAAVIWVVTQRVYPTNGCLNPNPLCFPLFRVHVKITECTNHALPIVSSEINHVSVDYQWCQFPA